MPCPWSRRCQAASVAYDVPVDADAAPHDNNNNNSDNSDNNINNNHSDDVEHWLHIRRRNIRHMRKHLRNLILVMSLMEAIRVGPVQMVFAGKQGYAPLSEENYGIAFTIGSFLSWIYMCIFTVVFVPLFSWWLPHLSPGSQPEQSLKTISCFLKQFNIILLHGVAGSCLGYYLCYTVQTFVYVDSHSRSSFDLPKNSKKNWLVRLLLLAGVAFSTTFGYYALQLLDQMDLAHIKSIEYYVLVIPFQINLGVFIGSAFQYKIEKRMERKAALRAAAMAPAALEEGSLDEKAALINE